MDKLEVEIKIGKRSIAVEADTFFALMNSAAVNLEEERDLFVDDMRNDDWSEDVINKDPYIVSLQEKIKLANDLKHLSVNYALRGDEGDR